MRVLILGVNGFIGSSLTEAILKRRDWQVFGLDIGTHKLGALLENPRFKFVEGDILINKEWIEYQIKKCDVVLPLVAIANPIQYLRQPLQVFELDFEANLAIVRQAMRYRKRLIFPSTSEVYGMCPDRVLSESDSSCVYGPIHKQRWIYAASKQRLRSGRIILCNPFLKSISPLAKPKNTESLQHGNRIFWAEHRWQPASCMQPSPRNWIRFHRSHRCSF